MPLGEDRSALSPVAFVALLIMVVVVGGAIGISYPKSGLAAPAASTSSLSSSSVSISSISSSSSPSATTATHQASAPAAKFVIDSYPNAILLSPGANLTYATILVTPLPSTFGVGGGLEVGSELVALNATAPSGISIRFPESNLMDRIYLELSLVSRSTLSITLAAANSITPGDYPITIGGSSGTYSYRTTFTVHVVKYLITAYAYAFGPPKLTVKTGSTVYWLDLGGVEGPENYLNLVFDGTSVQSPTLYGNTFDSWSHTFTSAGTYAYHSTITVVPMTGEITVTD